MNSRPAAAGAAARAITSRVHTPTAGTPSALDRTLAVTRPARRPVYGPGPVPTAIASRSARVAPPAASTCSMMAASSSPCRRELTVVWPARTRDPSCRATVMAGVAVSRASSSTVDQRRSRGSVTGPRGSANPGEYLVRRGERRGAQGGGRYRPEAAAVPRALHGDVDQHVAVPDHHGDLVRGAASDMEDLQRGERVADEPDRRAQQGPGLPARLGRVAQPLQDLAVGVGRAGRGAAVPAGQQARRVRLAAHHEHPEVRAVIQGPGALALR